MLELYYYLIEPFTYPFMQRALIMGLVIGTVCAFLSCFLVLKGWALMGDAISHAVLPGIILSYLIGLPIALGAMIAGLLGTIAIGLIKSTSRLKEDSAIGIVFSILFALGLFLFAFIETELHLTHILFGNILGINAETMLRDMLILFAIFALLLMKSRDLLLFCFDPLQLSMLGQSSRFYHYMLLVMLSTVIVISIQAVGILFVVALLIIPGMFGFVLSKRFERMVISAILFTTTTICLGIIFSYHFDVSTAPLIVVLQSLIVVLVLLVKQLNWIDKLQ